MIFEDGVSDDFSGVLAGCVFWSDIVAGKETVVAHQRFINVVVKNTQYYVDKQKNGFKRKIMQKTIFLVRQLEFLHTDSILITGA